MDSGCICMTAVCIKCVSACAGASVVTGQSVVTPAYVLFIRYLHMEQFRLQCIISHNNSSKDPMKFQQQMMSLPGVIGEGTYGTVYKAQHYGRSKPVSTHTFTTEYLYALHTRDAHNSLREHSYRKCVKEHFKLRVISPIHCHKRCMWHFNCLPLPIG